MKAGNGDAYYGSRAATVREHFPKALGEDDFVSRSEVALDAFGFNGENSIGAPSDDLVAGAHGDRRTGLRTRTLRRDRGNSIAMDRLLAP